MVNKENQDLTSLLTKLGYSFKEESLLRSALTHPSISGLKRNRNKKNGSSAYERLEFLGDRVLGLVIAHWLYELYPDVAEGVLAKRHASLVNRDALRVVGNEINLDQYLRHVQGDESDGSRQNLAAISDATEGIIGAIYLDGGLAPAESFIKRYWDEAIRVEEAPADPKTSLQEYVQGKGLPLPLYEEVERTGPAHAPSFVIQVSIKGHTPVKAAGQSKRVAEKAAALLLLEEISNK